MRLLFFVLVAANLLLFVWAGWLGGAEEGREPERLKAQLQADKIQVAVAKEEQPAATEPPPAPAASMAGSANAAPADVMPGPEKTAAAEQAGLPVCRRVGPLSTAEADKLAAAIAGKGGKATVVPVDGNNFWVFIPANAGKPVEKSAAELREAGITDFFVVAGDGAARGAISLGLFHKEEAAKDLQARLVRKGIKTAKIDVKPRKADKIVLEVQGPGELVEKQLAAQSGQVSACPGN